MNVPDNDLVDDGPLDYHGIHEHARTTSQGTYLDRINEGLEPLEEYQDGGYHPIHLGDALGASDRYLVIHKLGHGGFGTVWLCRDVRDSGYVAVKVMAGDVTPDEAPDLALTRLDQSAPGAEYIAIPTDSFTLVGPNGSHQCIVLPVLGPCVSPHLWLRLDKEPEPILRGMAYQSTLAMKLLHENGICHGDFRPANILVKLANINDLPEDKLFSILGQPEKAYVRAESGEGLPASSPQYLVIPADTSRLGGEYLTNQICVIDFGESFPFSSPPADLGIPENYLPPEVLLDQEGSIGLACDLWALGCTLFEIRLQLPLFYMLSDRDELLAEMVRFFGKPPQTWWDKWERRGEFFDDQGVWLQDSEEEWSLEVALSKPMEIVQGGTVQKALNISLQERQAIMDLLYGLLQLEPGKRLSIDEVLNHNWFKM
ncbi:hypothetical protein S7711_04506 [Stachybotrys chartarum IBT 7711]|uniref:EKC/KEOPS complex subunit BUD32 n=1 Tax=Stachybotrys chartarum (strain CBS 109288 / IBT 7711) TaxID=1280523 RepID=A0A084BA91_STACB|nr:hypothetical protein S7711_04506 [Stachybotrys chartarum IBT 7711]